MAELKICRICLRTEAKVYKLDRFQLKSYYEEVMAQKVQNNDNLPQYVCYECATLLHKFHKFKEKCYCGLKALKEILWRGPLTYEAVYKSDRIKHSIQSPLEIMTISDRVKSYSITNNTKTIMPSMKDEIEKANIPKVDTEYLGEGHIDDSSQDERDPIVSNENQVIDPKPVTVFIDIKKERIQMEELHIKQEKYRKEWAEQEVMKYSSITNRRTRFLDANNWKKYSLSEEEALKEFRARTEDSKYVKAMYKCMDCFKGFSKEEMLKRHLQLRHCEALGVYECRICRMRFKWDSHLRIHMRQHFTKYECLRCQFVCPLENTAILHEEYHSGVTRKCIHCGEEFRHASTYYTHLRTSHRSEYVCTLCGVSFVSETGLHQHKKVKHVNMDIESPDDEEEVNSYCERCDIRFETRKAFEEHLFHSVMHTEGVEDQLQDEITIPKKVLGKKLRAKITKELSKKRKTDLDQNTASNTKRKKRIKRKRRKPTTCHQCGKHFETQQACMKHHIAEHPRTSFYPPTQRHICEICGASLAPGSVAVHQNMHSKEKMYSCDTCGKQFSSTVGLKRHFITHTGEKPFACNLCDKRFTQSNSMKLHYRTFHLKQPYPKRNRRKKKDQPQESVDLETSGSESSSDESVPSPDMGPLPGPELEQVHNVMPDGHIPEEPPHYLTLH